MGVMSRRVLPACGQLCVCCPSLRARSRQPVKRYKKILADIFPKTPDGEANDRMIGKLCDYVTKNPMRVPKITQYLEQRCYKELRNEHFGMAKVVPRIYSKLLASCKGQMPLYAISLLSIIRTLLDQSRQYEMQVLGCCTLVDFLNCQMDGTYMFHLEGLIQKLCQLAQEVGEDDISLWLRSAGLQALASMILFMGEHSHVTVDFDDIVSATLQNFEVVVTNAESDMKGSQSLSQDLYRGATIGLDVVGTSKNPGYWSRVCLQNMSNLAKEATTMRHVLEPIFRYLDHGHLWAADRGVAYYIIYEMVNFMERTAQSSHLLLSLLLKHLDHKNVAKQPGMQVDIVNVTTSLAHRTTSHSSAALITAICDLLRHLRKCLQCSMEISDMTAEENKWIFTLSSAITSCLMQLLSKVGDVGPILDTMAVVLENISLTSAVARSTISAVYLMARLSASLPNKIYHRKAFPEALFHHLLSAMSHPDHETRVGSHRVLSSILIPKSISCSSFPLLSISGKAYDQLALLVALSCLSSPRVVFGRMGLLFVTNVSSENIGYQNGVRKQKFEKDNIFGTDDNLHAKNSSLDLNHPVSSFLVSEESAFTEWGKYDMSTLRLRSHQVGLLLSSIWTQALSPGNTPTNYEAIAHTFKLVLLFSQSKGSSHLTLVRCFQIAFSMRRVSLDNDSSLLPFCRRSLFTLSYSMLVLSAKSGNIPELISLIKSMNKSVMDDPYLFLSKDGNLEAFHEMPFGKEKVYGSDEDSADAKKFLSMIETSDKELRDMVASHLVEKYHQLSKDEIFTMKEQLVQQFSADDAFPHGLPLFMETPKPPSPIALNASESFDDMLPSGSLENDTFLDINANHSDLKLSEAPNASDILNVNQLIESVLETARQVASVPVSTTPVPYSQMKSQCEALVIVKQQKMSVLSSFKNQLDAPQHGFLQIENGGSLNSDKPMQYPDINLQVVEAGDISNDLDKSFRLPPSSPYDKFMKAAGC